MIQLDCTKSQFNWKALNYVRAVVISTIDIFGIFTTPKKYFIQLIKKCAKTNEMAYYIVSNNVIS